jgi:DNA-binding transcriptional MerR regulator
VAQLARWANHGRVSAPPDPTETGDARHEDPQLAYTVGGVARQLGVAPSTLRTWHRRYGLGPAAHADGRHRRYSDADVALLRHMQELVRRGVPSAEAAQLVTANPGTEQRPAPAPRAPSGGRILSLPGRDAAARGLARAAMALDTQAICARIREAIDEHGVVDSWHDVFAPVLRSLGERWSRTGECVEVEHVLSDCLTLVLRGVSTAQRAEDDVRPVLLACPDQEWHCLPAHVLGAALAERGLSHRMVGPSTPPEALAAAVRRTGPPAVFVWSQQPATASAAIWAELPHTRPRPLLVAGGPGWNPADLPAGVVFAAGLEDALALLAPATLARAGR